MNETLSLVGLTFEVRRSATRKTLGLTVDRGGELVVHAPGDTPLDELERWARKKLVWVHQKLAIKEELRPLPREPEYVAGESFYYLGRGYRLAIVDRQQAPLAFDGSRFILRRDARATARDHFRKWYTIAGSDWVTRRVRLLARKIAAKPTRITIRDLGFRWGSCGSSGVIFLNWRLLQLPVRLADYLITHELIHLREPQHSPAFWALLDSAIPDWRKWKEELTVHALGLHWLDQPYSLPPGQR